MLKSKGLFFAPRTSKNVVLPRRTNEYFLTIGVAFNLRFSLSLSLSSGLWSVQPKYCIYCFLIANWCLKIQIVLVYYKNK